MKRISSVDGAFYPSNCYDIKSLIEEYNRVLDKTLKNKDVLNIKPRAVIVPHAGYIYSGFSANFAHRVLKNSNPKRVIVIGPSHRVYIDGISGSFYDSFETPCKDLEIDRAYLEYLRTMFDIKFIEAAHAEHSTEVQMPFIKYYLSDVKVVEMVYGDLNPLYLSKICETILSDKDNAIVISTDLSHYYPLKEAKSLDTYCLKAVQDLDTKFLHKGCEACGKIGLEAIVLAAKNLGFKSKILDYRTSADANGDTKAVVGYMSAVFVE